MNDCPNADIRDQLTDLLHERLDPAARAEVVTHLEGCLDCRAELDLLRQLRVTLVQTSPRVDVARIVAALPSPDSVVRRRAWHRTWVDWRIAAAVTVIAIGGGSAVVLTRGGSEARVDSTSTTPLAVQQPAVETPPATVARTSPLDSSPSRDAASARAVGTSSNAVKTAAQGLDMTGRLGDLSEDQLQALLGDISKMEVVPMTEPEPVAVPLTTRNGATNGEGVE